MDSTDRSINAATLRHIMESELLGSGVSTVDPITRKMRRIYFFHEHLVTAADWEELNWHIREARHLSEERVKNVRPALRRRLRRPQHRVNHMLTHAVGTATAILKTLESQMVGSRTRGDTFAPADWIALNREYSVPGHIDQLERMLGEARGINDAHRGNYLHRRIARRQSALNRRIANALLHLLHLLEFFDRATVTVESDHPLPERVFEHLGWHAREAIVLSSRAQFSPALTRLLTPQAKVNRLLGIALEQAESALRVFHQRTLMVSTGA